LIDWCIGFPFKLTKAALVSFHQNKEYCYTVGRNTMQRHKKVKYVLVENRESSNNATTTTTTTTITIKHQTSVAKNQNVERRRRNNNNSNNNNNEDDTTTTTTTTTTMREKWKKRLGINNVDQWLNVAPRTSSAKDILEWAEKHPFLKVVRYQIPVGILPEEYDKRNAQLIDITVKPPQRGRWRVSDDEVYDLFAPIRKYVPRGLCLFVCDDGEQQQQQSPLVQMVIFAMKKFTGGPGDDDDDAVAAADPIASNATEQEHEAVNEMTESNKPRYEHYFLSSSHECVTLIETSKENGEASHLGQLVLDDNNNNNNNNNNNRYYVIGSKNVHLLVRDVSDLEKYKETRFMVAKQVAKTMLTFIQEKLDPSKWQQFMDYMHKNALNATFEFLNVQNQHVEMFDFEESKFKFIAFTSLEQLDKLCADEIEKSVQMARDTGFETITVSKYNVESSPEMFEQIFNTIRGRYGKEGSVLYYIDKEGKVIGLVKKKTVWYIMVRSIREKMKSMIKRLVAIQRERGPSEQKEIIVKDYLKRFREQLNRTIKQKQDWLKFNDQVLEQWSLLAHTCADWLRNDYMNRSNEFSIEKLDRMFPLVWNQFLRENQLSDKITL